MLNKKKRYVTNYKSSLRNKLYYFPAMVLYISIPVFLYVKIITVLGIIFICLYRLYLIQDCFLTVEGKKLDHFHKEVGANNHFAYNIFFMEN